MAGQPIRKANELSLLADAAFEALKMACDICPEHYLSDKEFPPNNAIAWGWRGTVTQARNLLIDAENLESLLYAKAELPSPAVRDESVYEDDALNFPAVQQAATLQAELSPTEDDDVLITTTCSDVDSIRWVIENLEKPNVNKQDCPSNTAWTLFKWALSNPVSKAEFINKSWSKLLPTGKQMDDMVRMQDDGTSTLELIARIQEATKGD